MTLTLDSSFTLSPQVTLRPEPFGALAYHFVNRRLVFLRHPDIVKVVKSIGQYSNLREALVANNVAESRWPSFITALNSLTTSEILVVN